MKYFLLVVLLIFLFQFNCERNPSVEELISNEISERRGEPALFKLNGINYSAYRFKEVNFQKKIYFENSNPFENQEQIKNSMNSYINEIILSEEVLGKVNFNSREYKDFIAPYIIQGTINFYFYKQSGIIEEMYNNSYNSELISSLKQELGRSNKNLDEKLITDIIKWRKIQKFKESQVYLKEDTLSKMRSNNKLIIINR